LSFESASGKEFDVNSSDDSSNYGMTPAELEEAENIYREEMSAMGFQRTSGSATFINHILMEMIDKVVQSLDPLS